MGRFNGLFLSVTKLAGYWTKPLSEQVLSIKQSISTSENKTKRFVISALLSAIAALLQSAGALGGPGFAISALVTLPIAIASILSVNTGVIAYITTLLLLLLIQPSEVIVFPFTTGLLGLGIGQAFVLYKKRASIITFSAVSLTAGIAFLLYIFRFPVLGPMVSGKFQVSTLTLVFVFSYLYSWLWVEVSVSSLKLLGKVLDRDRKDD